MTARLSKDEEEALRSLAGLPTAVEGHRECGAPVGRCRAVDHVHPRPFMQMDRREWMLSEGYTKKQIDEEMARLEAEHADT